MLTDAFDDGQHVALPSRERPSRAAARRLSISSMNDAELRRLMACRATASWSISFWASSACSILRVKASCARCAYAQRVQLISSPTTARAASPPSALRFRHRAHQLSVAGFCAAARLVVLVGCRALGGAALAKLGAGAHVHQAFGGVAAF